MCHDIQMEIQREKNRVVELTNETKKFNSLKKVSPLSCDGRDCRVTVM